MLPASDEQSPLLPTEGTPQDAALAEPTLSPQEARRRHLLKGLVGVGVAVPLIFTLQRSGRAAFFGSNQACINSMPDASTATPCQTTTDDKVRVRRDSFYDNNGTCEPDNMAGVAVPAPGDQCLVYYHPDTGWFPHNVGPTCGTGNLYGQGDTGYKVMTYTCWTSLTNTPGGYHEPSHPS
ncbi:MAG: hypothetical protein H7834_08585 [Magnetococcus sp. YQC-9]